VGRPFSDCLLFCIFFGTVSPVQKYFEIVSESFPRAAHSHSASVGSRKAFLVCPRSHDAQYAVALCQDTKSTGS
jgi:hypothetical protein